MGRLRRFTGRFWPGPATVDERLDRAPELARPSILLVKSPPWEPRLPPPGIGYLSAYLAVHGLEAPVWDCNIDTYLRFRMDRESLWRMEAAPFWLTPESVAEVFNHEADIATRRILAAETPYVGFSVTMESVQFTKLVCDRLRRDAPEKIIVIGGPGVGFPEFRAAFPPGMADLFVVGTGEEALRLVLVHRITAAGPTVRAEEVSPALTLWKDRPDDPNAPLCVSHPVAANAIVPPTFDGYDLCKYGARNHIALIMGLGCFRYCAFCRDRPDQGSYRALDLERLMGALVRYKEENWVDGVTWNDLILNGSLPHLNAYCDALLDTSIELSWDGQASAHRAMNKRPELFDKMARAGCTDLAFGVESFNDDVLAMMHKGYTEDVGVESLKLSKQAGIVTGINIICGFPGETEEQFKYTLDGLERHRRHYDRVASLNICAVTPGSRLWMEPDTFGIERPPLGRYQDWTSKDGTNTLAMRLDRQARMLERLQSLGLCDVPTP